jgi:selenium metabolism protein YedF
MKEIDARGLPCPQPVLLTRKAAAEGSPEMTVVVDNPDSADNVARFAAGVGYEATVDGAAGEWRVTMTRTGPAHPATLPEVASPAGVAPSARARVLLISSDTVGRGSDELGGLLVRAFLNALAENDLLPDTVVLLNAGVRLACLQDDTVAALNRLTERGVSVKACGTCLKYYDLAGRLRAGEISNAYEILNILLGGDITSWA